MKNAKTEKTLFVCPLILSTSIGEKAVVRNPNCCYQGDVTEITTDCEQGIAPGVSISILLTGIQEIIREEGDRWHKKPVFKEINGRRNCRMDFKVKKVVAREKFTIFSTSDGERVVLFKN